MTYSPKNSTASLRKVLNILRKPEGFFLETDGFRYILAWLSSGSVAKSTGSVNV